MKLAHLVAALALVSCGGQVTGQSGQRTGVGSGAEMGSGTGVSSGADDASVADCVAEGTGEWLCAGLGREPACPRGLAAGGPCLNNTYTTNPNLPHHTIEQGFTCLACAGGVGTVWTCGESGWQSGEALTCAP